MNPTAPGNDERDADPGKDSDPGELHSGEGLASMRHRLARTLADAELLQTRAASDDEAQQAQDKNKKQGEEAPPHEPPPPDAHRP